MLNSQTNYEYAYFGGGCFWCIEAVFNNLYGVEGVTSGYSGGGSETANYQDVSSGNTNHAEICRIKYDSKIINYKTLLEIFFVSHDPTTPNKQGGDIGKQYRSIILYNSALEKSLAKSKIDSLENEGIYKNIVTELIPFSTFYKAEDYHQNYFQLNSNQPYCKYVISPKLKKIRSQLSKYYK